LISEFKITNLGKLTCFLGKFTRLQKGTMIHQREVCGGGVKEIQYIEL